jgi:hypothetical protein
MKKLKRKPLNHRGFTHIEFLVVIVLVVAVGLVGVLVYNHDKTNSYKAHAAGWTSLGSAVVSYHPKKVTVCENYRIPGTNVVRCKYVTKVVDGSAAMTVGVVACIQPISNGNKKFNLVAVSNPRQANKASTNVYGNFGIWGYNRSNGHSGYLAGGTSSGWWNGQFQGISAVVTSIVVPTNVSYTLVGHAAGDLNRTVQLDKSTAGVGPCS